jgi:alpha-glucosidase
MWWKDAVLYQIYPRSFADTDGDGIGDLEGIRAHLDHLGWLGVDGFWLSPIFRSPMADFGYDVSDHCDVDPVFGTLAGAEELVAEAHRRGLRVLLDFVPNHTSNEHPWFRDHPERYVWRDGRGPGGDEPPNNWVRAFPYPPALPAWTRDPRSGRWYLHNFLPEQPDLDWSDPGTVAGMHDVLRFWLDRGVDGFRMDVVHLIGKQPELPDDPAEVAGIPHCVLHDDPATYPLLGGMREVLAAYEGDRVAVGEVVLVGDDIPERTAAHTGPDRLHLAFDFTGLLRRWGDAPSWRRGIARVEAAFDDGRGRWPTIPFGNHDQPRLRTRWGGSEAVARAAAVLQLGLRGTPVLYAGDELGLTDADVPADQQVDPGGRDGCRAPLPWTPATGHGWPATPWLPFPPDAADRSVEALRDDPSSILWLYKRLIAARKASPALTRGSLELLELPGGDGVVAWDRVQGDDRRRVLVSMADDEVALPAGWAVEVASHGDGIGDRRAQQVLAPGQAVVLRPA